MRCRFTLLVRALCASLVVVALSWEGQRYAAPRHAARREPLRHASVATDSWTAASNDGDGVTAASASASAASSAAQVGPNGASPVAATMELAAWEQLVTKCRANRPSSSAAGMLTGNDIPVVIMAGSRSEYLVQLLRSVDVLGQPRLVIVSFNRPEPARSHDALLTKSFKAAQMPTRLRIWPVWIHSIASRGKLPQYMGRNHQMKAVWVETMVKVWEVLRGHDGDTVFLEDDLVVAPDFFSALGAASQIKRANDAAVFAMGGWAGENVGSIRRPEQFVRKTWSAFPTMGYGFNRTLWDRILPAKDEIADSTGLDCSPGPKYCVHSLDDWSFAVSKSMRLRYNRTHDPYLRSFQILKEVQMIQPQISRVWHIGANSSIAEDDSQRNGWVVSALPPWAGHVNYSERLDYALLPGHFDYDGNQCAAMGEVATAVRPCDAAKALLLCQAAPPALTQTDQAGAIEAACTDPCLVGLFACSSHPLVAKVLSSQLRDMLRMCSAVDGKKLRFRTGCASWAMSNYGLR
jgi:hypothetical protein